MVNTERFDAMNLVKGDVVEYVGTTHDYSTARVTDIEEWPHGARRVTYACTIEAHPIHHNHYVPGDVVLKLTNDEPTTEHVDYPHEPGTLHGCDACEDQCTADTNAGCVCVDCQWEAQYASATAEQNM